MGDWVILLRKNLFSKLYLLCSKLIAVFCILDVPHRRRKSGKLRTSDAPTYTYTKTPEARTASLSSRAIAHFVRDPLFSFHKWVNNV